MEVGDEERRETSAPYELIVLGADASEKTSLSVSLLSVSKSIWEGQVKWYRAITGEGNDIYKFDSFLNTSFCKAIGRRTRSSGNCHTVEIQ